MAPQVSIVITTRNRQADLRRALSSCAVLQSVEYEILVYDDASDDGTAEMVSHEFSHVRLIRQPARQGYIRLRNLGFLEARGEFVVSIDDDAEFTDPQTLSRIATLFQTHPEAAAMALPFVEPHRTAAGGTMRPVAAGTPLRNYIGCAHAIRRSIALKCGGYPELLVHQGEERDLCIRLLDGNHQILFADTGAIIHHVSPNRSAFRLNYYGYRNTILFCWMRFPFPYCLPRMAISSIQLLLHKFHWRRLPAQAAFIAAGYLACLKNLSARKPVSIEAYRRFRSLPSHGPLAPADRVLSCESGSPG